MPQTDRGMCCWLLMLSQCDEYHLHFFHDRCTERRNSGHKQSLAELCFIKLSFKYIILGRRSFNAILIPKVLYSISPVKTSGRRWVIVLIFLWRIYWNPIKILQMKLHFSLFYYHEEGHVAVEFIYKLYRILSLLAKDHRNSRREWSFFPTVNRQDPA